MKARRTGGIGLALVLATAAIGPAHGEERSDIRRAAESYAVAACLTAQDTPFLKDQGDGWAANIVQREAFSLVPFTKLAEVVRGEIAKVPMATIIVESPPMTTKALPLQYCAEVVDVPAVRTAIERIVKSSKRR